MSKLFSAYPLPQILVKGLAFILWVGTVAFGLLEVAIVHRIFLNIYTLAAGYEEGTEEIFEARYTIGAVYSFSIVILGALWLLFFLISSHYHLKYAGQGRSWRLFAWTVAVQVLILVVDVGIRYAFS